MDRVVLLFQWHLCPLGASSCMSLRRPFSRKCCSPRQTERELLLVINMVSRLQELGFLVGTDPCDWIARFTPPPGSVRWIWAAVRTEILLMQPNLASSPRDVMTAVTAMLCCTQDTRKTSTYLQPSRIMYWGRQRRSVEQGQGAPEPFPGRRTPAVFHW